VKLTLTINLDNAAFEDNPATEIWSVCNQMHDAIRREETEGKLRDTNGNTVGAWRIVP
jgi:hypothetical protein